MEPPPEGLWAALERIYHTSAVRAEWERIAGPHFGSVRHLLKPEPEPATSFPCPEVPDENCPRGIIIHGPEDIVAVCRARPRQCKDVKLTKIEIVAYRLDLAGLAVRLRDLLELRGPGSEPDGDSLRTFRLGEYRPVSGLEYTAYLTVQCDPDEVSRAVDRLVAREQEPFLLLLPTENMVTPSTARLLRENRVGVLHLTRIVDFDGEGVLQLLLSPERVLEPFRLGVIETAKRERQGDIAFFETPAGATWPELTIRMPDGETASVEIGGIRDVFNYSQMGMADRRSSRATVQWKLLYDFAREGGELTWRSRAASREKKKRKQNLAKDLRSFFGITGDPFEYLPMKNGWRTLFQISE